LTPEDGKSWLKPYDYKNDGWHGENSAHMDEATWQEETDKPSGYQEKLGAGKGLIKRKLRQHHNLHQHNHPGETHSYIKPYT